MNAPLSYIAQIPPMKGGKILCSATPENTKVRENGLNYVVEIIKNKFQKSVADMLTEIMKTVKSFKTELKNELKTTMSEIVNEENDKLKSELELKIDIGQEKVKLKTLSESELLETYNRRDNNKIIDLEPDLADGQREIYQ